jgi:hypothetical protein
MEPSLMRVKRTGTAHSRVEGSAAKTAWRPSVTAMSSGSPAARRRCTARLNAMEAASEIGRCIATTAGSPALTRAVATPGEGIEPVLARGAGRLTGVEEDQTEARQIFEEGDQRLSRTGSANPPSSSRKRNPSPVRASSLPCPMKWRTL